MKISVRGSLCDLIEFVYLMDILHCKLKSLLKLVNLVAVTLAEYFTA